MELKGRLKLIANMVPKCSSLCDVGTDHAYLPIYLIKKNICKRVIASDVKVGPLERAKRNIEKNDLQDSIEARMGSGFENIKDNECDIVVIAGMGGVLIREILENDMEKTKKFKAIIIQSMYATEVVREFLNKNGFEILEEELVAEEEKIYNVFTTKWTGKVEEIDRINLYIGKKLIDNKDPLLSRMLQQRIKQTEKIIRGLRKSENTNDELEKYNFLLKEYKRLLI